MIEVSFWYEENLRPFLTAVGWIVGHNFDEDDWTAVSYGLRHTEAVADQWFEYEYYGGRQTRFAVAFDETGGSVVRVRVDLPEEFESRVRLLGEFCSHFRWRDPAV